MATRSCREKAQKLNEQHQLILAKLLREEDNKYCADCEAKGSADVPAAPRRPPAMTFPPSRLPGRGPDWAAGAGGGARGTPAASAPAGPGPARAPAACSGRAQ